MVFVTLSGVRGLWKILLIGTIGIAILIASTGCADKTPSNQPLPNEGFRARLSLVGKTPTTLKSYLLYRPEIVIQNNSPVLWPSLPGKEGERNWIRLAYRWYDLQGNPLPVDIIRTNLPHDLKPGQRVEVTAKVIPPEKPGEYILEFDIVQEGVAWFKNPQSETISLKVKVDWTPE